MLAFPETARCFGTPAFHAAFQRDIATWAKSVHGLSFLAEQGGQVPPQSIAVTLLAHEADTDRITLRAGVFFTELVGGCSCGDEPFETPGYRELTLSIERGSGAVSGPFWAEDRSG